MRGQIAWPYSRRILRRTPQKVLITRGFVALLPPRFAPRFRPYLPGALWRRLARPYCLPGRGSYRVPRGTISELSIYQGFLALTGFEPLPHRSLPARGSIGVAPRLRGQGQFTVYSPYFDRNGLPRARSAPLPARLPGLGPPARRVPGRPVGAARQPRVAPTGRGSAGRVPAPTQAYRLHHTIWRLTATARGLTR